MGAGERGLKADAGGNQDITLWQDTFSYIDLIHLKENAPA